MPFTPLHMGPGMLIKLLLGGSFSLMLFGWAQILMDIQPLIVIITGAGQLHGFSHTLVGAGLIATVAAFSGKPLIETALRWRWLRLSASERVFLGIESRLRWSVVFLSAVIGTFSHVYLDAIMHADLQPYYPFSPHNPMLGWLGVETLHLFCIYSGLVGLALFFTLRWFARRKANRG